MLDNEAVTSHAESPPEHPANGAASPSDAVTIRVNQRLVRTTVSGCDQAAQATNHTSAGIS